jgi:hypothetical protein
MFLLALLYKSLSIFLPFAPLLVVLYVVISKDWSPQRFFRRCIASVLAMSMVVGILLAITQVAFPEDVKRLEQHYLTVKKEEQ